MRGGLFLRACRGEKTERPPVWLMRQAGRYLPEYRELRKGRTMLETLSDPETAAEVTIQPVRRFGFDAGILFSDLTVMFTPMGAPFDIKEGAGPVLDHPVRTQSDIDRLRLIEPEEDLAYTFETIQILQRSLSVPLIGFTGAPFTLACYLVEGRGSKDFKTVRAMMHADPRSWHRLMELLSENVLRYLTSQIKAGASAVQLFDSWVGVLSETTYRELLLPHMRHIFAGLEGLGAPVIHFGTGTPHLLGAMADAGGDVIGVDWRITLTEAAEKIGRRVPLQGNLDPTVLLGPPDKVRAEVSRIVNEGRNLSGHIFNLGHGIYPETPIENVEALVETIQGATLTV